MKLKDQINITTQALEAIAAQELAMRQILSMHPERVKDMLENNIIVARAALEHIKGKKTRIFEGGTKL